MWPNRGYRRVTQALTLTLCLTVPALARTLPAPNLYPNPTLATSAGWTLSTATFKPGSIGLLPGELVLGPSIKLTPGVTYTCGLQLRGTHAPTDYLRLSLKLYGANGAFLRHSLSASDWAYKAPGVWQDAQITHKAASDETGLRILVSRGSVALNRTVEVEFSQVYCFAGQFPARSPKLAFNGGLVKVDTAGHVDIKQPNGVFKREFLRCMYTLAPSIEPWTTYSKNGWNCNIWAINLAQVQQAVAAGLPYSFFQLAQYIQVGGWAYGRLDLLEADIKAILNSPYAGSLIGYYYDNESPNSFVLAQQVLNKVAQLDTKNGVRQRPIYILQGNPGLAVAYTPYADITGSYLLGSTLLQPWLLTLQQTPGQDSPLVFGQIQESGGKTATIMRQQVQATLDNGGTAIGYWHTQPIVLARWYTDFPSLVATVLKGLRLVNW
jgi:hypothetical protein